MLNKKDRLEELRKEKFLTIRVFHKISENMHYEIFKNLGPKELLELRTTSLGGYQLISNKIMRSRIGNYLRCLRYAVDDNIENNTSKINLVFEQSGKNTLDFGEIKIGIKGIYNFLEAVKFRSETLIQEIDLMNCKIGDEGAIYLGLNLQYLPHGRKLNLFGNQLSEDSAKFLAIELKHNYSLECLILGNKNPRISLDYNTIGEQGAIYLGEALRTNRKLQNLGLYFNSIKEYGACSLAEALAENKSLLILNLGNNRIWNKGAIALAHSLEINNTLHTLKIDGNKYIEMEAAHAFSHALKRNQTLKSLSLQGNQIYDEGAIALSKAIIVNKSLRIVNIWDNKVTNQGKEAMKNTSRLNRYVKIIY